MNHEFFIACSAFFPLCLPWLTMPRQLSIQKKSIVGQHSLQQALELLRFGLGKTFQASIRHYRRARDELGINRPPFFSQREIHYAAILRATDPAHQPLAL